MIRKPSPQEKVQAILDTVPKLAEHLKSIDKLDAFRDFTKDEICGLIRCAQEGVQESLQRQADAALQEFDDEIPF